MKCEKINTQSFGARLTTHRYSGKKLQMYLENGIKEFEKQTKNKKGCMTLRQLVPDDESPNATFYFWNSKVAPHTYLGGSGYLHPYAQKAITTREFLKHLIVEKNPKEQANIFESIYDALQVIPKKLKRSDKRDAEYMNNLTQDIYKALGENKELLSPMFKHITDINPPKNSPKNLTINDVNF